MLSVPTRWRTWIAAVLLLALPLQGLAAACMFGCGWSPEVTSGVAAPVGTPSGHSGHGAFVTAHDAAPAGHAEHGGTMAQDLTKDHVAQHVPAADEQPGSSELVSDSGCSACAACFVGAAMPACEAMFSAQRQAQGVSAGAVAGLSHTGPDGLERPPRSSTRA